MAQFNTLAAEMLEASASAYATSATNRLFERHNEIESRYGQRARSVWQTHYSQRMLELAAAVRMDEPRLFAGRIAWLRKAFLARESGDADLHDSLECMKEALNDELPERLRQTVIAHVDEGLDALSRAPSEEAADLDPSDKDGKLALEYLAACLDGDPESGIRLVLDAVDDGLDVVTAYMKVLLPAQRKIGEMWHAGEVSVAEEHLVTESTRRTMAVLAMRAEPQKRVDQTVIAAAVAGNAHDIGIRSVADMFQLAGWRCIYLGADMPPAEIAKAVRFYEASLVVLSVALTVHLKKLAHTISTIKYESSDAKILVGGSVFEETPELWRAIGADGYAASADSAVTEGARLVDAR